jgi:hypothetical protein
MEIQYFIVALIVAAALGYVAMVLRRQTRSFTKKPGCEADCGCSSRSKEVKPAR